MKKSIFTLCVFGIFLSCGLGGHSNTLVIASSQFNGVFSPFFASSGYDTAVVGMVVQSLLRSDREGKPIDGVAKYIPPEQKIINGKTVTVYNFPLTPEIRFSDGSKVTVEDIIFSFKVFCDPTYDGAATIWTTPIVGIEEYRNNPSQTEIAGIVAIDDSTIQVTIDGVDPKAIWNLGGISVVPKNYYDANFKKSDLSAVKSKNAVPMGTGPYKFVKYENNVVSFEANEYFYPEPPKTPRMKLQVIATASKLDSLMLGETDIVDPNPSPENVEIAKSADLHYQLIDNLGYGYIGINAERVTDVNLRRGLMCLMNRAPAVRTYYEDLASVIERPQSKTSWAYPPDAKPFYEFNPQRAAEFFQKAGYENVDGKLIKDGKQLRIEVGIGGEGSMNHPVAPILTQMKEELEKLGGILEINDCDANILFDRLDTGSWDMWVAAWQSTIDPDMYQIYHSEGPSNHYRVRNSELDRLVLEARQTLDIEQRQEKYFRALDIIMEEAVEMPVYQRKNVYVFNPENIAIQSLAKDPSPFYDYSSEIQNIRMTQ